MSRWQTKFSVIATKSLDVHCLADSRDQKKVLAINYDSHGTPFTEHVAEVGPPLQFVGMESNYLTTAETKVSRYQLNESE